MSRSAVRFGLGALVVLILSAGIGGVVVWLKIAELKKQLVNNLGDALGAKIEIASLNLDPWNGQLQAAGISLTNLRPAAPWEKGEINQASIRFHFWDLFAPTLPLSVDVTSWNVVLHPYAPGVSQDLVLPSIPVNQAIRVTELSARQGEVQIQLADNKEVALHGVAFESGDNGANVWTTQLQATSIVAGTLEVGSSSVRIRGDRDKITFSDLRLHCGPDQGMITGEGEMALNDRHAAHAILTATSVPLTMLVGASWQMKLSGQVNGTLTYEGADRTGNAHGQLTVNGGKFNILPWLGKVTALVNLPDISDMEVDQAASDFAWKENTLYLTNLDVRKNGVARISGEATVNSQNQVDGHLNLGLPSTVTARWPQLQDKVFPDQHEDYNWAAVHVTGTPDHLEEDLTSRVLAVGMDQGSGIINQTTQKAMDLLKGFLNN